MLAFTIPLNDDGNIIFPQCTCTVWYQVYSCNCPDNIRPNGQRGVSVEFCKFWRFPVTMQQFYRAVGYNCTPVHRPCKGRLPFPCPKHERQVQIPLTAGETKVLLENLKPQPRLRRSSIRIAQLGKKALKRQREETEAQAELVLRGIRPRPKMRPMDLIEEVHEIPYPHGSSIFDQVMLDKIRKENAARRSPGFEDTVVDASASLFSHELDMSIPCSPGAIGPLWNVYK